MTTESLAKAFATTRTILSNVTPDQYGDSTPCVSWTVRDLVNHIVEGANRDRSREVAFAELSDLG